MNRHITIITPCYNESNIVIRFLESLEGVLCHLTFTFSVVVVNDCSTDDTLLLLHKFRFHHANISLHVVTLPNNAGHQAAIYQGFLHARASDSGHIIVMDSDGQDSPGIIPYLLERADADIVHVVRNKRREPLFFRLSYCCYKLMFRMATGKQMNFGNYCLISSAVMEQAIHHNFTHLAAFLSKQKRVAHYVSADREPRIGGKSKMSFGKLFRHAVSSFVEYGNYRQLRFLKRAISR